MNFTHKNDHRLRSRESIAREVHEVSMDRGLDELATVIALMTIAVETDWWCPANHADEESFDYDHDSVSDDGRSVGYFQQQSGPDGEQWWGSVEDRMTLSTAADSFLDRLTGEWTRADGDPDQAGQYAQDVQGSSFPDRYAEKWDEAWKVLDRALDDSDPDDDTTALAAHVDIDSDSDSDEKPDYHEFPIWSPNYQQRNGADVDLFILHTEEGGGGDAAAEDLANVLAQPGGDASYHYCISQASDGGVTVVDTLDTDQAAWSVLSANPRSINLCFAGSTVDWTRDEWLSKAGHAIDVAAYLAVQDCRKYGIKPRIIDPDYDHDPPGITDHRYVTKHLGDGTHTDVGDHFPWDHFTKAVEKYDKTGDKAA